MLNFTLSRWRKDNETLTTPPSHSPHLAHQKIRPPRKSHAENSEAWGSAVQGGCYDVNGPRLRNLIIKTGSFVFGEHCSGEPSPSSRFESATWWLQNRWICTIEIFLILGPRCCLGTNLPDNLCILPWQRKLTHRSDIRQEVVNLWSTCSPHTIWNLLSFVQLAAHVPGSSLDVHQSLVTLHRGTFRWSSASNGCYKELSPARPAQIFEQHVASKTIFDRLATRWY